MNLKDISKEELETMSYDDIAYLILENNKRKMKIYDLFKKVCNVLKLPDSTVEEHITDFFELLSTNKKFILLSNGYWDLAVNHVQEMVIEDDEDTTDELEESENDEENYDSLEEDEEDDIFYDDELDDNDDDEDDLKDLIIVDDEENNID